MGIEVIGVYMETVEEFYEWTKEVRNEKQKCVTNEPVRNNTAPGLVEGGVDETSPGLAVFWSEEEMDFPEGVEITRMTEDLDPKAPAVDADEVRGWYKYEVEFHEDN